LGIIEFRSLDVHSPARVILLEQNNLCCVANIPCSKIQLICGDIENALYPFAFGVTFGQGDEAGSHRSE